MNIRAAIVFTLPLLITPQLALADAEVNFTGTIVEEPCSLDPAESMIDIDFGTIASKYLYSYKRTLGKPFTLHLLECDLSLGNSVSITFNGEEDADQPGLIALDDSSTASGVAMGLETLENRFIPINQTTEKRALHAGNNELNFKIFFSADDDAFRNKKISLGAMNLKIQFKLNYE